MLLIDKWIIWLKLIRKMLFSVKTAELSESRCAAAHTMRNFLRSRNLSRQKQKGAQFGKKGKKAGIFFPAFSHWHYSLIVDTDM